MGRALIYIANEVEGQKIDAYLIVQSAESDRSYVESALNTLKTVFGEAAPKKAIILVTKAEALLSDEKQNETHKKVIIERMKAYKETAAKYEARKPILWFNTSDVKDDEDDSYLFADVLLPSIDLTEKDVEYYLPFQRREIQDCHEKICVLDDPFPNQLMQCMERIKN